MTYAAVLFDLFDTLVRFDRDRMPEIRVNGRTVRSTAGHLHEVLRSHAPEISLEACYEALVESWREAERLRAIDNREVPARERFDHFFRRLALDPARLPPGLGQTLIDTHRSQLGKAAEFPLHHGPLLERLARRYRLARSEEHTSELQSPCNLVCRLLLEKKTEARLRGAHGHAQHASAVSCGARPHRPGQLAGARQRPLPCVERGARPAAVAVDRLRTSGC